MAFNGTGSNVTSLNAANISSGTVATARLASGTANNTTYLRGDSTWATVASARSGATTTAMTSDLTLTNTSSQMQTVSANTNSLSIILPAANTLGLNGEATFTLINTGGTSITVKTNGGSFLAALPKGVALILSLEDNTTSAGVWTLTSQDLYLESLFFNESSRTSLPTFTGSGLQFSSTTVIGLTSTSFAVVASALVLFQSGGDDYTRLGMFACIGTISGTTITYGSTYSNLNLVQQIGTPADLRTNSAIRLTDTSFVFAAGIGADRFGTITNVPRIVAFTVSGTVVTIGSAVAAGLPNTTVTGNAVLNYTTMARISDTSFGVLFTSAMSGGNPSGSLTHVACSVSGTTITAGTGVALGSSTNFEPQGLALLTTNKLIASYHNNSTTFFANIIDISGTTTTWNTSQTLTTVAGGTGGTSSINGGAYIAVKSATTAYLAYFNTSSTNAIASGIVYATISGTTITPTVVQPNASLYGTLVNIKNGFLNDNGFRAGEVINGSIGNTFALTNLNIDRIFPLGDINTAQTIIGRASGDLIYIGAK